MNAAPERKLTTILAADAAGYSAMMERDETGTLALLKASREAMAGLVAFYRGRVVGTVGDSLLAEFASVVNAVECAVRIQRELAERDAALPAGRRMLFRIGINLGDVMVESDDLFGEGVNIAARLQALAEPGGILISGTVFDQVRNKLSLGFDFLGPQAVKNISEPVPAWRVVLDGSGAGLAPTNGSLPRREFAGAAAPASGAGEPRPLWPRLRRSVALAAVIIAFLVAINILTWEGVFWARWPTLGILLALGIRAAFALGR